MLILYLSLNVAWAGPRDVAVLWDSSEVDQTSHTYSFVFQKFGVILNHYGFKLKYFDVNQNKFKPQDVDPKNFYGLVSWFIDDESLKLTELRNVYQQWFESGKKVISLGEIGIFYDNLQKGYDLKKINKILKIVGLKYEDHRYENSLGLQVKKLAPDSVVEFERKLVNETPAVKVFSSTNLKNKPLIEVRSLIDKKISYPVIHNDQFFMVHSGFDLFYNPALKYSQWRINPFYIAKWFVGDSTKIFPDTTTYNGKRIFYSHIDGDAFINVSDVDRKSIAGKIILDEIIERYQLPVTVSFVVAELDPKYLGKPGYLKVAREIASKNNVELATHTYHHPLSWEKQPKEFEINAYLDDPIKYKGGPIIAYPARDNKLDYNREILDSLNFINEKIAPKDKQSKFILWSGSCEPPEEAMDIVFKNKLLNMNGGDSRFDSDYPSYSHLYPLYRDVGGKIQVHSSNTNEIPYTNNWKAPFSGQLKLLETFENTDKPIRMKPMNVYYHFYSGEKLSSLNTLKKIFNYVESIDVFPMFSSSYAQLVEDYVSYSITKTPNDSYNIANHKSLKTFRLDSSNSTPNYKLSRNVIGHKKINDSLYIFLGTEDSSQVFLTDKKINDVYLHESNLRFSQFTRSEDEIIVKGSTLAKHAELELFIGGRKLIPNTGNYEFRVEGDLVKIKFKGQVVNTFLRFVQ